MGIFNFEQQLGFYGAYHTNGINKLVHVVCVPAILWTTLVWLSNTGVLPVVRPLSGFLDAYAPFLGLEANLGLAAALMYSAYYISLEPYAGTLATALLLFGSKTATQFLATHDNANAVAAIVFVVSWIFQFLSHGIAEGRAPALLDNIFQAFVLAPFFVLIEVLFFFNYRPALHARVTNVIEKNVAEFRRGNVKNKKAN